MGRIISIDIAKAICIILVVIGHYVPDNSPEWYVTLHDIIYTFHMPLFMFASGYVYIATKKNVEYGEFLMKKIKRLMVPYLATSFIVITIKLLTQGNMSVDHPVTYESYLRMFYLPEAGFFLWFIWALWWMFVVVELMKTQQQRTVLFLVALVVHYIPMDFIPKEFCIAQFKDMLVFFTLGVIVYEHKSLHRFFMEYSVSKSVASIILFIVVQTVDVEFWGGNNELLKIIHPYVGIFFVIQISMMIAYARVWTKNDLLMQIATSSYLIYLFHTTFEGFVKSIVQKMPFNSDLWYVFIPEAAVVISVGVFVPVLLNMFLSRYYITRILFGYNKKTKK